MKISLIGPGRVGVATAFALVARGVPRELILVGRDQEKAKGDALDLLHASTFVRPMRVEAGSVEQTADSDIVILTISAATDTSGDRLRNVSANAALLRQVTPRLAELSPNAVFVVLTNPVDICAYVVLKASGLPPSQVLGTGTLIDTGRFRALLSRETGINANDIRAYILGEHGETQFPALSVAFAGGVRLDGGGERLQALFQQARDGGHLVMRHKGYTNLGVALSATLICEAIATDSQSILPVSTYVDGFKGVTDVCLSLPCVIGRKGVEQVLAIDLDEEEANQLRASASALRLVIDKIA